MPPTAPTQDITCRLPDGRLITLAISPDLTLQDLRDMIFSLSDIDPDQLHITLPPSRGTRLLIPRLETDHTTSLSAAGIFPGDMLTVTDAGHSSTVDHRPSTSDDTPVPAILSNEPAAAHVTQQTQQQRHQFADLLARSLAAVQVPSNLSHTQSQSQPRSRHAALRQAGLPPAHMRRPITVQDLRIALDACVATRPSASPLVQSSRQPSHTSAPPKPAASSSSAAPAVPPPVEDHLPNPVQVSIQDQATPDGHVFVQRIRGYYAAVLEYEDPILQAKARACIPEDAIRAEAANSTRNCPDAALTKALLSWFKRDFFKWVNSPDCWACGGKSKSVGVVAPTDSELLHRAGNVELHQCTTCNAQQRFPRYNDPAKLLETRRGRCGEWQQAFTLICISMGLIARAAHDETDHVWTEVWSHKDARWLHADSCEDCLDEPLLYESGWGKKLTYVIATGKGCVADVTRRYTAKYDELLTRRTIVSEGWLAAEIGRLNREAVAAVPSPERASVLLRNSADEMELQAMAKPAEHVQLPGRQSGSAEWKHARGEDGDRN